MTAAHQIRTRDRVRFAGEVTLAHVLTYLAVGTLAYFLLYKEGAVGLDPGMRRPDNPEEWRHVETWLIPAQLLRGLLFGTALLPFLNALRAWSFLARFGALLGLLLAFSVWSVTMPGSGSIEGWVYLRPSTSPSLLNPLLGHLEVPTQLALFSLLVSWRIGRLGRVARQAPGAPAAATTPAPRTSTPGP
jgi:hypothetical protein